MNNKNTIVIIGGSAGADIAAEIFRYTYNKIRYLETYSKNVNKEDVIANNIGEGIEALAKEDIDYFIATGDNRQREANYKKIYDAVKKDPVNCIHPTAYLSLSSKIGFGNLICPKAVIHTNAVVGNNTIINTGAIVEHDCYIEDFAQISPNVTLCGNVHIGKAAFIGAGSVIIPKIKVDSNSIVAAGSSIISHVESNVMYAGVPAKKKKNII